MEMNDEYTNQDQRKDSADGYYRFEPSDQAQHRMEPPVAPAPVKKKKTRLGFKIAALCLVCVILGTVLGTATIDLWQDLGNLSIVENDTAMNAPSDSQAEPTPVINTGVPVNTPVIEAGYTGQPLTASEIYATVVDSVVGITTPITTTNIWGQESTNAISGSGFLISEDGYIFTNYHVIETALVQKLEVKVLLYNGEEYSARIVGIEPDNDIALIKIDAKGLKPVVMGSLNNMAVGDSIYALGNPLGMLTWTLTDGIVSAFDREISADANTSINMFQISAAINSGNSGGPVFNDRGEVIGIASMKFASSGVEGLGFAIPIDDVNPMIDDFIEFGYVRGKVYFGITVSTVSSSDAELYHLAEGAYVQKVDQSSCAGDAGLREGDIITKVDDHEITSTADLKSTKKLYKAGDTATLTVFRAGSYLELSITFDEAGDPRIEIMMQS
jgi:serine protease Do